jgi:hypothetical protein
MHADSLQSDRVDHSGGRLDDPRRRMTVAFGEEQPLDDHRAERRQVDDIGVLDPVAETAARRHHRVGKRQRPDTHRQIDGTRRHRIAGNRFTH